MLKEPQGQLPREAEPVLSHSVRGPVFLLSVSVVFAGLWLLIRLLGGVSPFDIWPLNSVVVPALFLAITTYRLVVAWRRPHA